MKAKIRFRVQDNKMHAVLLVGRPSEDYIVTMKEIEEAMKAEGICFGICRDRIKAAVDNQSFLSEIPCANGEPPIAGKDGTLKFTVPTTVELRPKIRDDGTADYHDLGLINEIDEGRLLCRRTLPTPGVDGTNIYGEKIPYRPGILPEFPAGEGTAVSLFDETKLVSAHSGYIKFENGIISVPDTFILDSDIDNSTGDIHFRGDIVINGCVREGFKVSSEGSITINGTVEGATITAGKDVIIKEGFTGMEDGRIFAGGNIESRYLQNMTAKCGGTLTTEYALHSFIMAGNGVTADEGRGTIAGGELRTCGSVTVKNLGADTYVATKIAIDELPVRFWDPDFNPRIIQQISDEEMSDEELSIPIKKNAKIVVRDCAYPEVRIQIGVAFYNIDREERSVKFLSNQGELSAEQLF